jgi:DNA-binding MarR family transcriptional regulator
MPLRFIPQVHRATHRIGLHIERLGAPGVSQAEAHILAHLADAPDSTIADVHRAFAHKRSTLTSILDRLEARGFILRASDPRDRRTFRIALTPPGRIAARRVTRHLEAFESRVLRRASARDLQAFQRVLDALDRALAEN